MRRYTFACFPTLKLEIQIENELNIYNQIHKLKVLFTSGSFCELLRSEPIFRSCSHYVE